MSLGASIVGKREAVPARQLALDFTFAGISFFTPADVARIANCDADQVLALIDSGKLAAVDVRGCYKKPTQDRLPRITRPSFLRLCAGTDLVGEWEKINGKINGIHTDDFAWALPKLSKHTHVQFLANLFRIHADTVRTWFTGRLERERENEKALKPVKGMEFPNATSIGVGSQMAWRVPISDVAAFCERRIIL